MKLLKAALFTALFSCAGFANADLVSNVPLDTSRFELMSVSDLSARAAQGSDHAQFYLAKRLQKAKALPRTLSKPSNGILVPLNKALLLPSLT